MVPVFKNVGEGFAAKNYHPVSLFSVVSKVFEKLVNNRVVDHIKKHGLFSEFQYGFRSSESTADVLKIASDRTERAFNKSGPTQLSPFDISAKKIHSKNFRKSIFGASRRVSFSYFPKFVLSNRGCPIYLSDFLVPFQIFNSTPKQHLKWISLQQKIGQSI